MFLWAKQLVFHVRQAASNLRARTDTHSLLCPDSPAHGTEPLMRRLLSGSLLLQAKLQRPARRIFLKIYQILHIICLTN